MLGVEGQVRLVPCRVGGGGSAGRHREMCGLLSTVSFGSHSIMADVGRLVSSNRDFIFLAAISSTNPFLYILEYPVSQVLVKEKETL